MRLHCELIGLFYNKYAQIYFENTSDTNSIFRQKHKQQVLLVFPRDDIVCDILQDACSQLEMDTFLSQTLPEAIESFQNITNGGHNLIIVDGRLPQILDPETVARYVTIKSLTTTAYVSCYFSF